MVTTVEPARSAGSTDVVDNAVVMAVTLSSALSPMAEASCSMSSLRRLTLRSTHLECPVVPLVNVSSQASEADEPRSLAGASSRVRNATEPAESGV